MNTKLLITCLFILSMGLNVSISSQEDDGGGDEFMSEEPSQVEDFESPEVIEPTETVSEPESEPELEVQVIEVEQPVIVQPVEVVQPVRTQPVQSRPLRTQPVQKQAVQVKQPAVSPLRVTDADRMAYIDRINSFRSTIGLPALQRWTDGETCADNSAKTDGTSGIAHKSMGSCGEFAQNSCPNYDSIASGNPGCIQMMWNEGPPPSEPCTGECYAAHGHYINMTNKAYTKVAVGFYQMPNGKVWINMNFK